MSITAPFPSVILVDANFLIAHVDPKTSSEDRAKIDYFIERAEKAKSRIVIPMPAVAEYLVRADEAALDTLNALEKKPFIYCAPFDRAAAYECALLDRAALGRGDKKDGKKLEPWQKIKIDRQIVAIAKANGVKLIITMDEGVQSNAKRVGIEWVDIQTLELPEKAKQVLLPLVSKN